MIYTDKVMDHFRNPRNVGEIEDANGVGEVGNAKCGDIMRVYLKVEDNIIKDVKFQTFGCGSAIASSSMATEMIKGKTLEEAWELSNKAVAEALDGLPPVKMHCSVLAEEAKSIKFSNSRLRSFRYFLGLRHKIVPFFMRNFLQIIINSINGNWNI